MLVHTSDTQIRNWEYGGVNPETGLNRRFEDALSCLDFVIDHAIENKARFFIHAGDVNEERNPDSIAIEEFAKRVKRITGAGIEFIMIAGNHDVDSSIGCTTSISYLKALEIPHLHIADKKIEVFEFDDVGYPIRFLCLPYFYKSQLQVETHDDVRDYILSEISQFNDQYADDDEFINVCVSHYTVDKVFEGLEVNEAVIPIEAFKDFDYNAFGHIHQYISYDYLGVAGGYCGSPYRVNFGEKEKKYFNVVDFNEGSISKVLIPNRDFEDIILDAREADHKSIEEFVISKLRHMKLNNKFLKITIKCYEKFNLRAIYQHLQGREIFHYAPIIFDQERVKSEARLKFNPSMTSIDILRSYLDKQENLPDEFKKQVLSESESAINAVGL